MKKGKTIKKGQIVWCELNGDGSEQKGLRPCVIVQNDVGNRFSPTTIIVPLTSRSNTKMLPTHLAISSSDVGVDSDSIILAEQIRIIDKNKIKSVTKYKLSSYLLKELDQKMILSLGIIS